MLIRIVSMLTRMAPREYRVNEDSIDYDNDFDNDNDNDNDNNNE
jgi:hypothetical protein